MQEKLILSGFGGQGILSAGLLMAEATVIEKKNVTYYPSYGAEMRGGTANCQVIFSDKPIALPIIDKADSLIAMNMPSVDKFMVKVRSGGLVIVNSSVVKSDIPGDGRKIFKIPAEELAFEKLKMSKAANVIILGAYIKLSGVVSVESLKKAVAEKFAKKGDKVIETNYKAIQIGWEYFK